MNKKQGALQKVPCFNFCGAVISMALMLFFSLLLPNVKSALLRGFFLFPADFFALGFQRLPCGGKCLL